MSGERKLSFGRGEFEVFKHTLLKMSLQPSSGHCKVDQQLSRVKWGEPRKTGAAGTTGDGFQRGSGQRPRHTERHE